MATNFARYLEKNNNIILQGYLLLEDSKAIKLRGLKRGFEFSATKVLDSFTMSLEQLATIVHDCLKENSNFREVTGYHIGTEILFTYDMTSIWVTDKNESVEEICNMWNMEENKRINASRKFYLVGIKTCSNKIRDIQMISATSEVEARGAYERPPYERLLNIDDIVIVGIFDEKEDVIILKEYQVYFDIEKLKKQM